MAVLKDLIVHGNSRFINAAYFKDLIADTGRFQKLTTDEFGEEGHTISVYGIMNVEGELNTKSWTNANIATIGGNMYICPTISIAEGSTGIVTVGSGTLTFSPPTNSSFALDNLLGGSSNTSSWTQNSLVLVTGEILYNNEYLPMGTLKGKIGSGISTSSFPITNVTNNKSTGTTADIFNLIPAGSYTYRNLKISIYEIYDSSKLYPLGIYFTAMGSNGRTFIDIYGGNKDTGTATAGAGNLAEPNVRIGNLKGLPQIMSTYTPTGWGIYTNNGYFTGTIVAKQGKIGEGSNGWTIGNDTNSGKAMIYTGTRGSADSAYLSTGIGTESIAGSGTLNTTNDGYWAFTAGANFGVTTKGKLYAQNAQIVGSINATTFNAYYNNVVRATVDNNGLTIKDASGNTVANFGLVSNSISTMTLGQVAANKYNVLIDSAGIKLRYNTSVLNLIDTNGMKLYLSSDTTNPIAQLGSTIQIGKSANAHINLTAGGLEISKNTTLISHLGYGQTNDKLGSSNTTVGDTSSIPYFTFGSRATGGAIHATSYIPGINSIVMGQGGMAQGNYSVSMGYWTEAIGDYSFAEGSSTFSIGSCSHAEGSGTIARGPDSHAGGMSSETLETAPYSFVHGEHVIASARGQAVFGKFNEEDTESLLVVGNGTGNSARSNLMTIGNNSIRIGNLNEVYNLITTEDMSIITNGNVLFKVGKSSAQDYGMITESFPSNVAPGQSYTFTLAQTPLANTTISFQITNTNPSPTGRPPLQITAGTTWTETSSGVYTLTYNGVASFTLTVEATSVYSYKVANIQYSASVAAGATLTLGSRINLPRRPLIDETLATDGFNSVALGTGIQAYGKNQTVIGRYNEGDISDQYPFIIGNGSINNSTGAITYSNALTVDWQGVLKTSGAIRSKARIISDPDMSDGYSGQVWMGRGLSSTTGEWTANRGIYDVETSQWLIYKNTNGNTHFGNDSNVYPHGNCNPNTADTYGLGTSTYRWNAVYAKDTSINTSDRKDKDVLGIIDFAKDLIMTLEPIKYMWKKGDHRRTRMGFIAQDTAEKCKQLGLNLNLYTASYKANGEEEDTPNHTAYYGENVDDERLVWGMSYEELIAPMVQVMQDQQKEIERLKEEVRELKNK